MCLPMEVGGGRKQGVCDRGGVISLDKLHYNVANKSFKR